MPDRGTGRAGALDDAGRAALERLDDALRRHVPSAGVVSRSTWSARRWTRRRPRSAPDLRRAILSSQSGPGERVDSLDIRRPVELPKADIDEAGDLAPA